MGSSRSAKSSMKGSQIFVGSAYDLNLVNERKRRKAFVRRLPRVGVRTQLGVRGVQDPLDTPQPPPHAPPPVLTAPSSPANGAPPETGACAPEQIDQGERGCDTDEAKGELLGFEEVRDALEGEVEVYFGLLELDEEGVEEGVGG
jgi:hypothetical protein